MNRTRVFSPAHARPKSSSAGFTIIELMIVVVVLGILAAIAFPSFMGQVRKSRRSEAFAALSQLQQAQERYRSSHNTYATTLSDLSGVPTSTTYYDISLVGTPDATSYAAKAVAARGSQVGDAGCQQLGARMQSGNLGYASGAAGLDWFDPGHCWNR